MDKQMTLIEHLEELRRVLIISLLSVVITSVIGYIFSDKILLVLTQPAVQQKVKLVYIGLTEAFWAKLQVAVIAGVILALPVILWQLWSFILPALQANERRYLFILTPLSLVLFLGGVAFGFFTVFRYGIRFLLAIGGPELTPMITINKYLSFTVSFLVPFGLIFELPLAVYFLARLGLISYQFLAKNRKYALFLAFVVAAVLSPSPDVVTQTVMAVPMYVLYEASIWVAKFVTQKKERAKENEAEGGMA